MWLLPLRISLRGSASLLRRRQHNILSKLKASQKERAEQICKENRTDKGSLFKQL
jgi:hypothetical protein